MVRPLADVTDAQVTGGSEGLISWEADVVLPPGDTGYSARRRRLQGFPLPGTRGYPSSHYKCASASDSQGPG